MAQDFYTVLYIHTNWHWICCPFALGKKKPSVKDSAFSLVMWQDGLRQK